MFKEKIPDNFPEDFHDEDFRRKYKSSMDQIEPDINILFSINKSASAQLKQPAGDKASHRSFWSARKLTAALCGLTIVVAAVAVGINISVNSSVPSSGLVEEEGVEYTIAGRTNVDTSQSDPDNPAIGYGVENTISPSQDEYDGAGTVNTAVMQSDIPESAVESGYGDNKDIYSAETIPSTSASYPVTSAAETALTTTFAPVTAEAVSTTFAGAPSVTETVITTTFVDTTIPATMEEDETTPSYVVLPGDDTSLIPVGAGENGDGLLLPMEITPEQLISDFAVNDTRVSISPEYFIPTEYYTNAFSFSGHYFFLTQVTDSSLMIVSSCFYDGTAANIEYAVLLNNDTCETVALTSDCDAIQRFIVTGRGEILNDRIMQDMDEVMYKYKID